MRSLIPVKASGVEDRSHLALPVARAPWGMDRLFGTLMGDLWDTGYPWDRAVDVPSMDIVERDEDIRVIAEVPGVEPKDLEITLTDQVLTLAAEKRDEVREESERRTWSERRYGTFRRAVRLPCPVEADGVEAVHRNGVVTITLKKSEAVRPKRIKVDIA